LWLRKSYQTGEMKVGAPTKQKGGKRGQKMRISEEKKRSSERIASLSMQHPERLEAKRESTRGDIEGKPRALADGHRSRRNGSAGSPPLNVKKSR